MSRASDLNFSYARDEQTEDHCATFLIQRLHEGLEPSLFGQEHHVRAAVAGGRVLTVCDAFNRLVALAACDLSVGATEGLDDPSVGPVASISQSSAVSQVVLDAVISTALVFQPEFKFFYAAVSADDQVLRRLLRQNGFSMHSTFENTVSLVRKPREACAQHAAQLLSHEDRGFVEDARTGVRRRLRFDLDALGPFREDLVQAAFPEQFVADVRGSDEPSPGLAPRV